MKVILASGSPRRKDLLKQVGIDFEVCPADVEERYTATAPAEIVMELSALKANAVASKHKGEIILAADTVVANEGAILGKPKNEAEAEAMLKDLSGKVHQVYTGVTIVDASEVFHTFFECTNVYMYENSEAEIREYVASGEPMDKAGGYGIQGLGAKLIEKIDGDYNNVVGLPVSRVYRELSKLNS